MKTKLRLLPWALVAALATIVPWTASRSFASEYREYTIDSNLVPSPVEYGILLPEGYSEDGAPYPLLLNLHGGGGDREFLHREQPIFDAMWADGSLTGMVVVTPSVTERGFYMDYRDGTQKWESFIVGPFLDFLRKEFNVRTDREGTLLTGISMGGQGSLRLILKYPQIFGAAAAMEPGIDPVLRWEDMQLRYRWWRSNELLNEAYGTPFDAAYWEANNPATIVDRNADAIRAVAPGLYIDVGDEDLFWLYEATEFMHRVLYDNGIRHEYHLVHGADHVGASIPDRTREALGFLEHYLNPPPPDPVANAARSRYQPLKDRLGVKGHYDQ